MCPGRAGSRKSRAGSVRATIESLRTASNLRVYGGSFSSKGFSRPNAMTEDRESMRSGEIMAKREPAKPSAPRVTLAQLKTEPGWVVRAARRAGGVSVVDDAGQTVFRLWMPG